MVKDRFQQHLDKVVHCIMEIDFQERWEKAQAKLKKFHHLFWRLYWRKK